MYSNSFVIINLFSLSLPFISGFISPTVKPPMQQTCTFCPTDQCCLRECVATVSFQLLVDHHCCNAFYVHEDNKRFEFCLSLPRLSFRSIPFHKFCYRLLFHVDFFLNFSVIAFVLHLLWYLILMIFDLGVSVFASTQSATATYTQVAIDNR